MGATESLRHMAQAFLVFLPCVVLDVSSLSEVCGTSEKSSVLSSVAHHRQSSSALTGAAFSITKTECAFDVSPSMDTTIKSSPSVFDTARS